MFYCREKELSQLNKFYNSDTFECIVIYGRRRVGKTALINEFCKDKPTIFFSALSATISENLENFSKSIYEYRYPDKVVTEAPIYPSFDAAMQEVTTLASKERLILVIDEFPYLAKADESIQSRLQHIIDHKWQTGKLFLILCGSSMSFMENQVLGYESPIYGRRTAQIKLEPLKYRDLKQFYPKLSNEDLSIVYGITGGIPLYINKLNVKKDIKTALIENFFDTSAYLFEEPENLLKQELREPALYNSIISAIAGGASRSNEISTKAGIDSGKCAKYIQVLIDLGILKKETPMAEKSGKKTIYTIKDPFFRFWYRFVPRNMTAIISGKISKAYDSLIGAYLHDYMGLVFEDICRDYLMNYADNLPITLVSVGQWWGPDPVAKKEVQIDIIGKAAEENKYIIGSCKYRNKETDADELDLLKDYAKVFNKGNDYYYYIFSLGGFTKKLKESKNVVLLTLDDIY